MSDKPFIDIEELTPGNISQGVETEICSGQNLARDHLGKGTSPSHSDRPESQATTFFPPIKQGAIPTDSDTPSIAVPPPPARGIVSLPDSKLLQDAYETYLRQKGTYNPQELLIRGKILLLLSIYPRLSPTMIQMGLGPTLPAALWRPVFNNMLIEGVIKQYGVSPGNNNKGTIPVNRVKDFIVVELVAIEDRERQAAIYRAALEAQIDNALNKPRIESQKGTTIATAIPSNPPAEKIPSGGRGTNTTCIDGISVPIPSSK